MPVQESKFHSPIAGFIIFTCVFVCLFVCLFLFVYFVCLFVCSTQHVICHSRFSISV